VEPATAVAADGGIVSSVTPSFHGSTTRRHPARPADRRHGRVAHSETCYRILPPADGGYFGFGDAGFFGGRGGGNRRALSSEWG